MKEPIELVFLSDYLKMDNELSEAGVFDCLLNSDSHFFINLLRLKNAKTPEFINSYDKINVFFSEIMMLLKNAKGKTKNDKFFQTALSKFSFGEVNGINLGFSESSKGNGFGKKLSEKVISDAYDIVKAGSCQPEIFHLVSLFEDNVAADRLSDMIATLVYEDIYNYTIRINKELGIVADNYPDLEFRNNLLVNPYKGCEILYLPCEILHELPIATCWDDIDRVITENRAIRDEINLDIRNNWLKLDSSLKKQYILEGIFKDKQKCSRIINQYREEKIGSFSASSDTVYFVGQLFREIRKSGVLSFLIHSDGRIDSKKVGHLVLETFKDWVENNAGWKRIQDAPSKKREKTVQSLIQLSGKDICKRNNFDFTFEPNEGSGPADIKISRGAKDKTVIEVKLNTNPHYLKGYTHQINEYLKAEETNKAIYTYIEIEDAPEKTSKIVNAYNEAKAKDKNAPDLVIIDSKAKKSASK